MLFIRKFGDLNINQQPDFFKFVLDSVNKFITLKLLNILN